ncbi:phosphatase and actin regulator 2-like isoform X3 [Myxocyprinus asiaticus]|uniref:phosphatase and actin regulator 2-like isoform X3 n=1 Tax=Myxocyprinus asiaticus TaxID=70543 RepID=UPI0022221920|nr:phosphatase and actin regulator 2-like isoform X3 [Myxocyprinus asiaticus]
MMTKEEDSFRYLRTFPQVFPVFRVRSQSDTSGFKSRIMTRLHSACSVEGLEKSSLANCDVVGSSQSPQLKGKGKLSTLGKIFKPWKWRKKRTSDKFQDLSKVLERKISTRQTREELIRKGVLIPDQDDPLSTETLNGHAVPSEVTEKVKVDIETQDKVREEKAELAAVAEDPEAKSSNPKKTAVTSKNSTQTSGQSSSATCLKTPKNNKAQLTAAETKSVKKAEPSRSPRPPPKPSSYMGSSPLESSSKKDQKKKVTSNTNEKSVEETSQDGKGASHPAESSVELDKKKPHVNDATEETAFTGSSHELFSDILNEPVSAESEGEKEKTTADQTQRVVGTEEVERTQTVNVESPEVTVIPDSIRENQANDSDSDGPILYKDDEEEDEDDDEYTSSSLASKIHRRDTLAIKIGNRPSKRELEEKNILPRTSETERQELRQQIGCKLVRQLSQRPTTEELEQRNILKQKNEEEEQEAKQEIKRRLSRKLSVRPTVAELVARRILRFNEYVEVTEAKDYDRRADKPWTRLTPADKAAIRKELNEFKSKEMEVHEDSRQFTRFHRP